MKNKNWMCYFYCFLTQKKAYLKENLLLLLKIKSFCQKFKNRYQKNYKYSKFIILWNLKKGIFVLFMIKLILIQEKL
jgi:hypothetical protein